VRSTGLRSIEVATWLRGLVLAHRDLADALTDPRIGYAKADQWNGFVPPATTTLAPGASINTSPRRAALRAICVEAIRRERGAADAEAWEMGS
jgi:hypothetical protein